MQALFSQFLCFFESLCILPIKQKERRDFSSRKYKIIIGILEQSSCISAAAVVKLLNNINGNAVSVRFRQKSPGLPVFSVRNPDGSSVSRKTGRGADAGR